MKIISGSMLLGMVIGSIADKAGVDPFVSILYCMCMSAGVALLAKGMAE